MKSRTLGKDFTVSAVGLGCMGMSHGYGKPRDKKEMTELLAQVVDFGYTFFDTAEVYGTPDNPHANETQPVHPAKPSGLTVSGTLTFSPAPKTSPYFNGQPMPIKGSIEIEGYVDGDGNLTITNAPFVRH